MNMRKRAMSLLCSLILLVGLSGLTASAAEPEVEWLLPQRFKVGDCPWKMMNIHLGGGYTIVRAKNMPSGYAMITGGYIRGYSVHAGGSDYDIKSDGTWTGGSSCDVINEPRTYNLQIEIGKVAPYEEEDWEEKWDGVKVGTPYRVVVEEPVITTNAPSSVDVGASLQLTTQLTNLNVKNRKVKEFDIFDFSKGEYIEEDMPPHWLGYRPSVEVVEGKNIVKQSNQDYTNTLHTSEQIAFTGAGTVKLKIKYEQIQTCGYQSGGYSPEKVITIQVKSNTTTANKPATPPKPQTPSSAPTGKPSSPKSTVSTAGGEKTAASSVPTPTESMAGQPSLVDTGTNIAVTGAIPEHAALSVQPIAENEEAYTAVKEKLPEQAVRFQSYDISLLDAQNVKVQPDGQVQISIPKPQGFGNNLAVYRTETDQSMTRLDSEVKDGKVVFTTDHSGLYTIAELAGTPVIAPPAETPKGGMPLGGIIAIVIGALVVIAGGVTAGIFLYRKKKAAV